MKIAVACQGDSLDASVDCGFGECAYFIIADSETGRTEAVLNPAVNGAAGACRRAIQCIVNRGVKVVIAGHVGPNAFEKLKVFNLRIYRTSAGSVRESLAQYKNGELKELAASTASRDHPGHPSTSCGKCTDIT